MQSGTATTEEVESFRSTWGAGVAGGFAGGVGMGILLHGGANLMPFVGALYGWPTVVGGVLVAVPVGVAHVVYGVVLGATYGVVRNSSGVARPVGH